ncbi:MAG: SRPBCC family protein [Archangium sp.]|nr:SRPBCC family protein [Archangium sp.]
MIKKFSIALVALIVLTLAVGLVLPRTWRVERHVVINATPARIHPLLFDLKRWQEWSVWTRALDPMLRNTYEGPQDGVGAKWMWLGPTMGRGQIVITASDPLRGVELDESIESEVVNARASLAFTAEGDATRVTWVDEGTLPPVVGGFFRGTVEDRLGAHFATSLEKLKAVVEAQTPPN